MTLPRANTEALIKYLMNSAIEVGRIAMTTSGDLLDQESKQLLDHNERNLMRKILSKEDFKVWKKQNPR